MADVFDYLFNTIIIGNSTVGKSSLMLRFVDDVFYDSAISTCGADFRIKTVHIAEDNKHLKICVTDTGGQERFRSIRASFYRNARGVIIVYSVDSRESFDNIKEYWLPEVLREISDPNVPKILVGNKSDLPDTERQVTSTEGAEFARCLGIPFVETSARTGAEVERMFLDLVHAIYQDHRSGREQVRGNEEGGPLELVGGGGSSLMDDINDLLPMESPHITLASTPAKKRSECCK